MTNEETIFAEALGKDSAAHRAAYLDEACAGNADLRRAVDALLRAHRKPAGILEEPPATLEGMTSSQAPLGEGVGSTIGPYKLLEQIGGGGMGVVFMAEQLRPVRRKVALKIIKPGMDSGQVIARFEAERQALTMMDHPNIAKVLDAGTTDAGRPYFVMELVKGIPITDYCDQARLDTRQRLELFMQVCHAVQHAHQKGVIHRDLKPSNVLVTLHDDKPVPKVIDFGIAKAAGQVLTDKTLFTNYAQLLGTPLYMSPEQTHIGGLDVDTRSDVYSLGVLLYELLTGTTPFDKQRLRLAAYDEMRRIIREEDPPKPSTRISSLGEEGTAISAHRHTDAKHLSQLVHGDLDWIVMKALEKDRARRYETANGLARDVERHLLDEAVQACPPSGLYRFRKFARRNKATLVAVTLVVAALVLGTVISTWQALRARRAEALAQSRLETEREVRARAVVEAAKATAISDLLQEMLTSANPDQAKGVDYTVRQLLDDSALRLSDQLKGQLEIEAAVRAAIGNAYRRLVMTDKAEPHLRRALAIRRERAGNTGSSRDAQEALAQSLHDYGWNLLMAKRHADAERHLREAVAVYKANGVRSAKVIETLSTLQLCIGQQERRPEAEAVANEALVMGRAIFPEGHGELANVLHRLAEDKQIQRDLVAAEALSRQAVAMHVRWHGNKHPETAWGFVVLGKIQSDVGRHAEAGENYRLALNIMRGQYGETHSVVTYVVQLLQQALTATGDKAGLAALQAEQTARLLTALERDSRNLDVWVQFADFLSQSGDLDGAISKINHAVELATAAAPEVRNSVAQACSKLAKLLREKQRPTDAERAYRQAIMMREPLGDKAPPELRLAQANEYNDLAFVLPVKRLPEAERVLRTALELKQALVNDFPDNREYRIHLAHSYLGLGHIAKDSGRTSDAVQTYGEAARILNKLAAEASGTRQFERWLSDTLSELGHAWLRVNRSDDAKQAHQNALGRISRVAAEFPEDADFQLELAGFLRDAGDLAGAVAQFSKILDKHPDRAEAWTGRASAYLHLQQWDRAVADYSEAIELAPRVHTNWFHRGHLYLRLAQWDKAAADFTKVVGGWPNEPEGWFLRALAYAQLNQPVKAITDLRQAFAKGFTDVERVKNDSKLDPLDTNDEFKKLLAELESRFRPALDTVKGAEYLRIPGELDQAIKVCSEILARQPEDDAAWRERANCYMRKGAYAKAAEDFSEAIRLRPDEQWYWHERGYCYMCLGLHEKVIVDYSEVIRLTKDIGAGPRARRAHAYRALGQLQKAEEDYSRAIELNPAYWEYWHARARLYHRQQQSEKAKSDLANAVKLVSNPGELNGLAWALATDADPSWRNAVLAVELAEKAIATRPADWTIWNTVGAARYRNRQWKEAISALEKSMELRSGGDSNDWFFLSMCHWQLGDKEAARKWYDQAVVWMDKNQPTNGQLLRFRTEAEELLKIAVQKPTTKPQSN